MRTPCVDWTGPTMNKGYGRAYVPSSGYGAKDAREELAHRLAWERAFGPIPKGMTLHHGCENKLCQNLGHMELLWRDEHAGGRGHGKLTRQTAQVVKDMLARGCRGVDVAAAVGVSKQQVCNIRKGRCWA